MRAALIVVTIALVLAGCRFSPPPEVGTRATPAPTAAPPATPTSGAESVLSVGEAGLSAELNRELNGQLQVQTAFGPAAARDLSVLLRDGKILLNGDAQSGLVTLPLSVVSSVDVRAGRPVVSVEQASLGGVALPDPARREIARALQAGVDDATARARFEVDSVSVDDGQLTVRGRGA